MVLENWYDESKEKFPDIIHSFNRYLQNKDKSDIINDVKKQIIVMLYNNRNMIQDNNNKWSLEKSQLLKDFFNNIPYVLTSNLTTMI